MIPVICGPTAVGKTSISMELFENSAYEAISADSMQIYRFMDIATAKPIHTELKKLKHHLIDKIDPDQDYSLGHFYRDALSMIENIFSRNKTPLIVGGTGLYIKTLLNGFFTGPPADKDLRESLNKREEQNKGVLHNELADIDPLSYKKLHPNDLKRIIRAIEVYKITGRTISELKSETKKTDYTFKIAGIIRDREDMARLIKTRIEKMFDQGFVDEVKMLLKKGYSPDLPSMQGLGYKECIAYLKGTLSFDEMSYLFIKNTKAFARRQIMLFKRIPGINWFHAEDRKGLRRFFR